MIEYTTQNWLSIVTSVRGTVLPRIAVRMLLCVAIAAVGAILKQRGVDVSFPPMVHTIVGVALGLLLVFRTNASYDRFWEGRKLVGGMVNRSRDMARQTAAFFEKEPAAARRAGRYLVALYATIRRYLRKEREWPELADVLDEAELAELRGRRAPPLVVARWLGSSFCREAAVGRITQEQLQLLDSNLTAMMDLWGGAERIMKTPVPFAYAHHIKVFLTLFCLTVPFALLSSMTWFAMLGAAVVAFGLFGIDEIGVEIEDPFGYDPNDLPLDAIGETLGIDVKETVEAELEIGHTSD